MSKPQVVKEEIPRWEVFSELRVGDLFALNTASDVFQRISLNSREIGNCVCLDTGKLHYVIPDDSVLLVDATLTWRFQKVGNENA